MKKLLLLLLFPVSAFAANTLTWDYLASDVTLYGVTVFNIERKAEACSGTGSFAEIVQVNSSLRTYDDANVTPGVTYCYRAAATGPGGKSPYSNTVAKTVPFAIPAAPGNLR